MPGNAVAISSANGLEAVRLAHRMLTEGASPVDAAVEGVCLVELDPNEHTVGYGGLPNFDGVMQLDAAVMDGKSGKGGAVAGLEGVKTPSKVARGVMQRTDHVILVGEGARRFAAMHGLRQEDILSDFARKAWLHWREHLSDKDDWVETPPEQVDPEVARFFAEHNEEFKTGSGGTIHLSALTPGGDLGCCTSTAGLYFKVPGRVGDSPIIGAGLYCDNDVGSAGSTGRGEAAILAGVSLLAVEFMRGGLNPSAALRETLKRVVHLNRDRRLRRADGRPNFNLNLYALNKAGEYASIAIWSGGRFAVADPRGARIENQEYLYQRPDR